MKNRTKTISLLVAVCMMITLLPAVAMAKGMENVRITDIKHYDISGWLKEVSIEFDVSNSSEAVTNFGIHKNHEFKESTTNDPTYGDFTNVGDYADNHDYNDWDQTPPDCNFIAWDSDIATYMRPGNGKNYSVTIHFNDYDGFSKNEVATYYVYAWTESREIYPDVMVCSFSVNNKGTLVQSYPVSFDANGGTGSMSGQGFVPGEAQVLVPNAFTRTDYTFTGWNTEANGSGTSYADGAPFTLDASATSGLTLYAQWKEKETSAPGTVDPGTSSGIDLWYNGGNSFGSSNSAVPTSVEIDNLPVSFTGNGREFTVGCISPNAKWVTVNWNSTSVTTNFTPDANATCAEITLPKTGDVSVMAFALMAVVAAAGAMGKK